MRCRLAHGLRPANRQLGDSGASPCLSTRMAVEAVLGALLSASCALAATRQDGPDVTGFVRHQQSEVGASGGRFSGIAATRGQQGSIRRLPARARGRLPLRPEPLARIL
jgi:hypothetical protein